MWIGYLDILRNVYKVCCQKLQHGEKNEIFIFGFSRGACMCSPPIPAQEIVSKLICSYFSGTCIVLAVCWLDQGGVSR